MKKQIKIISAIMAVCLVLCLFGCSKTTPSGETDNPTGSESTSQINPAEVNISEDEAKELAYSALLEADYSNFGITEKIKNFEFQSCTLNDGDWRKDQYGYNNPVWTVEYTYKDSLGDYVYFDIDAEEGVLLYSGYMGD